MSTQQDLASQAPLLSDSAYVSYGSYQADGRDRDNVSEAGDSYSRQQPESFIVVGANDGAYGLGRYYDADYTTVSVVFLSPFLGYATAAMANSWIHERFGQRGIALLGTGMHVISYFATTQHPPFPLLITIFILAGLGNGIADASWNAWIGAMHNSSQLMGILHAFYGLGAALAPLTATYVITQRDWMWYHFYYIMGIAATIEFVTSVAAFWSARGSLVEASELGVPGDNVQQDGQDSSRRNTTLKNPTLESLGLVSTWIISLFLLVYVGIEVTVGGWVFTFLVDLRNTPPSVAGVVTFMYWGGLTVGRVCLGFITPYFKRQRLVIVVYLLACVVCHIGFWLATELHLSMIAVTLLGFFLGPLYPEAVIAQAALLPKHLHVAAVGFACALGSAGGCIFPFITGAIAKAHGIKVLHPVVLAMLMLCLILWFALPGQRRGTKEAASPAWSSSRTRS
ncbi:major facilitator superfamily domain-containing protein [Aspergillus novoparasiticus]|uniref:Major facilitator superfamily domain-containing protein n=1 Tax=Aspergillus novoparasiticus TaxID=986946 RepID=A0A5N6EAP8_9EURO|nr:major facilitator superfamily domain-containing protein [Aspergillus novoparasiticus]